MKNISIKKRSDEFEDIMINWSDTTSRNKKLNNFFNKKSKLVCV